MYRLILWAVALLALVVFAWRLDHFRTVAEHLGHSLETERAEYAATIKAQNDQIAALEKNARATAEALQIAAAETQAAHTEAAELRRRLAAIYESDPDAALWADTPLPDAVCRLFDNGASRDGD